MGCRAMPRPVRLAGQRLRRRPDKCDAGRRPNGRRIPRPAPCAVNSSRRVHTPLKPRTAHTAAHTPKHGGFSGSVVTMFSAAGSSTPSPLFRQISRSPLLLRKDTVMPFLLRASTLLRIRWGEAVGGQSLHTGRVDLFQQHLGRGADLRLPAQQFREEEKNSLVRLIVLFAVI